MWEGQAPANKRNRCVNNKGQILVLACPFPMQYTLAPKIAESLKTTAPQRPFGQGLEVIFRDSWLFAEQAEDFPQVS